MSELGKAFFEFSKGKKANQVKGLERALDLWKCMSTGLAECKQLDTGKFNIIQAVQEACKRLESHIRFNAIRFTEEVVQKHQGDLKASAAYVSNALGSQTPESVSKLVHTLTVCGNADQVLASDSIEITSDALQKLLPSYMKFKTIDVPFLEEVAPNKSEQITGFTKLFDSTLKSWISKRQSDLDGYLKQLEKYRRV